MDARPPLDGSIDADVVVIGGGFTGLWTAWDLVEAGARVVLLEAGVCGHGPSGRNGGFCESMWLSAAALRRRFGDAGARALLDASSAAVTEVGDWCRNEDVDAWFDQSGYVCVSTAPAFDEVGRAAVEAAAELGAPERIFALDAEQVRRTCAAPLFRRGVSVPDFATLHPARLALGLRRRLIERGVAVFEHSHVRALRSLAGANGSGGGVVAETAGGRVRAGTAVLAVGPAARALPELRSRLSVTSSHIVLTEPVPDVIEELGWTGGECFTDGRTLVHYFRTTRDGRILFGWGGGRLAFGARVHGRVELDQEVAITVREHLAADVPGARRPAHHARLGRPDRRVAQPRPAGGHAARRPGPLRLRLHRQRRGPVASGRPHPRGAGARPPRRAHPPADRRVQRRGVGAARALAWLGGSLVRSAMVRREHAEELGERTDPLTRALCEAPRALGMHLAR